MRAQELAVDLLTLQPDDEVLRAVELIADHRVAAVGIAGPNRELLAVLSPCDVLRLLVPGPVRESPALARVIEEHHADHLAETMGRQRLRDLLPGLPQHIPIVPASATALVLAAVMTQSGCPLAVVRDGPHLHGVVTPDQLLHALLAANREPA
jgi:CBS-domain-containing membrane protein